MFHDARVAELVEHSDRLHVSEVVSGRGFCFVARVRAGARLQSAGLSSPHSGSQGTGQAFGECSALGRLGLPANVVLELAFDLLEASKLDPPIPSGPRGHGALC